MDKILYSPKEGTTGFRGLRNVPEEPKYCTDFGDIILVCESTFCKCKGMLKNYNAALESCKSNGLEFVNPDVAEWACWFSDTRINNPVPHLFWKENILKSGDIFDLPEGYKLEKGGYCEGCRGAGLYHCAHADTCGYAKDVLRLVKTETKDFEWKDDMKLFDKKIDVAHIGHGQPEPEESHIETEIECLSRRLRNNAELLINPHMYERVRMNLIEIAEQLVTIQRKKQ